MLILLSPAKTLDLTPTERDLPATKPEFLSDTKQLAKITGELSQKQVAKLMDISDSLAETAHGYFQDWKQKWDAKSAKQAVLMFRGDVYQGLDADTLSDDDLTYAQDRLRLISGLYGLLRPLDLMQAYRLEMGTKLKNSRGKDLYDFWQTKLSAAVDEAAQSTGGEPLVVNLASKEYAKAVQPGDLETPVVAPEFKDKKNGKYRIISFYAKQARGTMARFLIQKKAKTAADLRKFRGDGYRFNRELSTDKAPVFTRDQPS
ncbi:MAG: peroxide stress protein YaaA [Planctomycetota bacterium]